MFALFSLFLGASSTSSVAFFAEPRQCANLYGVDRCWRRSMLASTPPDLFVLKATPVREVRILDLAYSSVLCQRHRAAIAWLVCRRQGTVCTALLQSCFAVSQSTSLTTLVVSFAWRCPHMSLCFVRSSSFMPRRPSTSSLLLSFRCRKGAYEDVVRLERQF